MNDLITSNFHILERATTYSVREIVSVVNASKEGYDIHMAYCDAVSKKGRKRILAGFPGIVSYLEELIKTKKPNPKIGHNGKLFSPETLQTKLQTNSHKFKSFFVAYRDDEFKSKEITQAGGPIICIERQTRSLSDLLKTQLGQEEFRYLEIEFRQKDNLREYKKGLFTDFWYLCVPKIGNGTKKFQIKSAACSIEKRCFIEDVPYDSSKVKGVRLLHSEIW